MEQNLQSFISNQILTQMTTLREQLAITSTFHQKPLQPKTPKITLNSFGGTDPLDWIFQAEQYFELNQTPPHQRLTFVPFFMQGHALGWFKWLHSNNQLTTWAAFIKALELRFRSSTFENYHQVALFK